MRKRRDYDLTKEDEQVITTLQEGWPPAMPIMSGDAMISGMYFMLRDQLEQMDDLVQACRRRGAAADTDERDHAEAVDILKGVDLDLSTFTGTPSYFARGDDFEDVPRPSLMQLTESDGAFGAWQRKLAQARTVIARREMLEDVRQSGIDPLQGPTERPADTKSKLKVPSPAKGLGDLVVRAERATVIKILMILGALASILGIPLALFLAFGPP